MTGLKIVEAFDHAFTLDTEAKDVLYGLLAGESFCQAICRQKGCDRVGFTTLLFQPAPYTVNETKGMPVNTSNTTSLPTMSSSMCPPISCLRPKFLSLIVCVPFTAL